MPTPPFCFVVMPFRAELNYFYLYIKRYLEERHALRVERGDHRILTKPLMEKVREQIETADFVLGDVSGSSPNVFYELGLAHAAGKPVIFLTQDEPESAPVDIRQFEFIQYDLLGHEAFLAKLSNAIRNVFVERYRKLYEEALKLLQAFNHDTASAYPPALLNDFQDRVMLWEQSQVIPSREDQVGFSQFLLPKILRDATDFLLISKVSQWIADRAPSSG